MEQVDVVNVVTFTDANTASPWTTDDHTLYQTPVKTITWYHTGAARVIGQFEAEYFPHRFANRLPDLAVDHTAFFENPLSEPEMPAGLDADEWREALRAAGVWCCARRCTNSMWMRLAQALLIRSPFDCSLPRSTTAMFSLSSRAVATGTPRFLVTESEALTYHYELDLRGSAPLNPDPRIAHTLNLRHDEYGNAQQSVTVGYQRWKPGDLKNLPSPDLIHAVQAEEHIAYVESRHGRLRAQGKPNESD